MKKVFTMPLLLMAIFVISSISTTVAEAADVPDFRQVAGNYVRDGERVQSRKGYRVYAYECSVDLRENFAEQYINLLRQNGLALVGHEANDWRRTSAQYLDKWFFRCKGLTVEFWRYKYFGEGRTSFSVRIANGLTYGGR